MKTENCDYVAMQQELEETKSELVRAQHMAIENASLRAALHQANQRIKNLETRLNGGRYSQPSFGAQ